MQKINFKEIKSAMLKMLMANHSAREIALGMAIGSFISILPLYGLHTVLCLIAALLIPKANKLAILLGTNISLPPTVPTITWTAYDIGRFLLPDKHYPPLSWEYIKNFNIFKIREFYFPLFIGSVVLGFLCAVSVYFITLLIANHLAKRRSGGK